mgnify:CR=1 FL=1
MKLKQSHIDLFKTLSKSKFGEELIEYLRLMQDDISNSRNWKGNDSKESANKACEYIDTYLINKLISNSKKGTIVDDYS